MEGNIRAGVEWDRHSDVDLYSADMTEARTAKSTKVPEVSTSSPPDTSSPPVTGTGGATSSSSGGSVCIACQQKAVKFCPTCPGSYCDKCVQLHYIIPALHGHKLVVAAGENVCQTDQITNTLKTEKMDPEFSVRKGKGGLAETFPFQIKPFPKETLAVQHQLFKKGPPDCYRLPTRKSTVDENGAVRRWTFGQRDETATVKNILIVGETGTGKTTLINAIVNYLLGVEWDDGTWFQITEEEDKERSQDESQTTAITVYEVFVNTSSLSLRIIDTPGYGSTDGPEFDKKTAEYLHQLFRSEGGIHEINAVGLVVKSGQNRLTPFQHYIFDAILSLFGKDIEGSIVTLITHSDGMSNVNNVFTALNKAKVPCAKQASGEPIHFIFNNIQSEDHKEKNKDAYQKPWDLSYFNIEKLLGFLQDFGATELKMTEGVLRERKRLEACVNNLHDAIKMEELKQDELQQTQRALEENKEKCGNNEDFTFKVTEPYKEKVPIDPSLHFWTRKATCCTVCEENCHYPGCWWVSDLSWCSVMKDNKCTVCTRKCPVTDHLKKNTIYVPAIREVTKTYKDLKQQYEKHVDVKKGLEKELAESKMKKKKLLDDAYQCIVTLEKIALKKDSGSTLMHLDFLIEKMEEMGEDKEKVEKLIKLNQQSKKSKTVHWWPIRLPGAISSRFGLAQE